jgi:putative tryptophan/tyrosine transport system substrate-binding protein
VLMGYAETDREAQSRLVVFRDNLAALGWAEGRNLSVDVRWSGGDVGRASMLAREVVGLRPDVIVSSTTPVTLALQRETATIPIVFTVVADPVGSGFVKTLSHPGGNVTGFTNLELSLVDKWLELLNQIAPRVTRVAVMFNPDTAPYAHELLGRVKAPGPSVGLRMFPLTVRSEADIRDAFGGLAREPDSGLMVMVDSFMVVHRKPVIALAARHRIPAIYFSGFNVVDGGLISYGVDVVDQFRRAATYVDRILHGAKPAELPVQQPAKYELFVNQKTARALGLTIPPSLLLRADQVIE